ncbi:MAG TPA: hypothetical protein VK549_09290 [Acidimicrobiia bacterium]|nr:hypothetical protein [Acidimicrobiia bacterium]
MKGDAFESRAELLGTIPVPIASKAGVLRLRNGRLTFTSDDGEIALDAPTHELHSAAVSASGIHIWHGSSRMRFAFGRRESAGPDARRANQEIAERWVQQLAPMLGAPPSGTRVRRPWPSWAWIAALVIVMFGITFVVATLVSIFR